MIPQSEKIGIKRVIDIKKEIYKIDRKFSEINREFKRESNNLKASTHGQLKKNFLNTFKKVTSNGDINENYLNKTLISFSLFRLNQDDEVKDTIIRHIDLLNIHIEGVLHYFKRYYNNDPEFFKWIHKIHYSEIVLFHYNVALVFREFPELEYSDAIFDKHFENNKSFWLIKYFLLDWLVKNDKTELINSLPRQGNVFFDRKLEKIKIANISDSVTKKRAIQSMMKDRYNDAIALAGVYHYYEEAHWLTKYQEGDHNDFVKNILTNEKKDYINYISDY